MRKLVLGVVAAALLGACGDDDDGGGGPLATALSITGSSLGPSITATDAAGFTGTVTCDIAQLGGTVSGAWALAVASTAAPVCADIGAFRERANSTAVGIALVRARSGTAAPAPVEPGAYPVNQPVFDTAGNVTLAVAEVVGFGAACGETELDVRSGTITVDSTSGGTIRGRVDVQLDTGGTVTGTFAANACAVPANAIDPAAVCSAASLSGVSLSDLFPTSATCVP